MPLRLALLIVAIALPLTSPVLAAGLEPCMQDNKWCDGSHAEAAGRVRPQAYSTMPTDPDGWIRLQMLRDKTQDKGN